MATTKLSAAEVEPFVLMGAIYAVTVGAVTAQEVIGASKHPPMRIIRIHVFNMVGSTASNASVLNGSTTMVTAQAVTVTAIGNTTNLTIISNTDVVPQASSLAITTTGANDTFLWIFEYENV